MLLRMVSTDLAMIKSPGILVIGKKYRLGRSSECSFVVNDLSVSRFHAELVANAESIVVTDLKSMNGTFVDGVQIEEAEVKPGQTVVFGTAKFKLAGHEIADISSPEEVSELSTFAVKNRPALSPAAVQQLSDGQRRVLDRLLTGLSEKEVASKLGITPNTVHNHVKEIYRRLGVNSRAELLALFIKEG